MRAFPRVDGVLHAESVPLPAIAERVGTPAYVYSRAYLRQRYRALSDALAPCGADICYAVKANSNLQVLREFHALGAGFDIVSGGELERVLCAGGRADRVIFSGVGKREDEIDLALKVGIRCFNVESRAELDRLAARARLLGRVAPVSLRVNPDVDARTHPYISTGLKHSKFGVPIAEARDLYHRAADDANLRVDGIDCHIGSQIHAVEPLLEALASLLALADDLQSDGIELAHIDVGGGLGVSYQAPGDADPDHDLDSDGFDVDAYGAALNRAISGRRERLVLEPGRYLVANGGVLLTRVEYLKPGSDGRGFAVVDAAMNDLIRPALYQAWHDVRPVSTAETRSARLRAHWNVVGPVCESGDFLAEDRDLALAQGDLLAVCSAGAYGMVQSSNYNTRGRPAEVLVDGDAFSVIRRRETVRDQLALELPEDAASALLPAADARTGT
ncbi:MAG: diaminopimelate decarboxylase [Pseudomonadales bacterium]